MKAVSALLLVASALMTTPITAESAPRVTRVVIKVTYTETTSRFQDWPPESPDSASKGDVLAATGLLRNAVPQFGSGKGAIVGTGSVRLVWKNKTIVLATLTANLPDGTLLATAVVNTTRAQAVLRISKGTGHYKGMKGSVTSFALGQDASGDPLFARIYNLRLPTTSSS